MQRFCQTLQLRPDPALAAKYVEEHAQVPQEILKSLHASGILDMQIFHLEGTLFMIMDTTDEFTFECKAALDAANPHVQQWEARMARYQNVAPDSDPSDRWRRLDRIFALSSQASF